MRRIVTGLGLLLCLGVAACDSKPAPNPFEVKKDTVEPPPITSTPKPTGPPEFTVSEEGAKIGWTYLLLDKEEGKKRLADQIAENKAFIDGKEVAMNVTRPSKLAVVAEMIQALNAAGATDVAVATDSRPEFPKTIHFLPMSAGKSAASCSVVAKVLPERLNAVWSLKGGTAVKSSKGLAGPDMAVTANLLEAAAKRCKDSDTVFVSADDAVEWGLVYDLAGATQSLEKAKFGKVVLLEPAPTAGRPVALN